MRLPAITFTTLLATTFAMTSVVYADEQADKQAIMKAYAAYNAAIERKDVNQIFADYAPEFTIIRPNGKLTNLEQERQQTQNDFKNIRQIKAHDEIKQIQINGQTATVIGIGYTSAIGSNPNNPQVPVPFSNVSQYQDIWKRTPGGWKLISTHVLQSNVNGQQASQVNENNLTPAQRQSLAEMKRRYMQGREREMQGIIEDMRMRNNMMNCMNGVGYGCGSSIIGN
ncbi:nuclear transport factor 2 family protein [Brasilonema bromeliae]|uniref:DUF4440 domain-containing protein n=1 Tax=Brasilonema bromeliae SPC951 TaxID=385972 RepID=A0ABX1P9F5_9CYAN|nr:nuclear transport factor 2 family protein [Brasilonema bromeliae]NMG21039.1 hypothetical protein [Brasilonema bromeliae SPC951]